MTSVVFPPNIPAVAPAKARKLPQVAERVCENGLRVLVTRLPGVPRFEARIHIPTARPRDAVDAARHRLMAKTLLAGTKGRSSPDIAVYLQSLGASLDAYADAEEAVFFGSALAPNLRPFLELVSEVVRESTYPDEEVALEQERLVQELALARSQPATIAREAFLHRLYGDHPYGRGLPTPEDVQAVTPANLRKFHRGRLLPKGSVLVLVGDLKPKDTLDRVEAAFSEWTGTSSNPGLRPPEPLHHRAALLVHRPGAVQTNIRMGAPAVNRSHPDHPAISLANLVFGGYFSSRLVDNIRERRGYTYSPGSGVHHTRTASYFSVVADVGTDVTGPALVEIAYELGLMAATRATDAELTAAKRYLAGSLAMSTQTQAGLAAYLATLVVAGLDVEYLREFPKRVAALGADDVQQAAQRWFAPSRLLTVLVGDAGLVRAEVEALGPVEVQAQGG